MDKELFIIFVFPNEWYMKNPYFHFKQFTVRHDRCAMRVGTDGVLLGAWARVEHAQAVLDIGTGSGLMALMAAQRNPIAKIVGLEIDEAAAQQALENARESAWGDRIEIVCTDVCIWHSSSRFDAIVSNPPFFVEKVKSPDKARYKARHTDSLSFENLVGCVCSLLTDDGEFSVIVPADSELDFISLAATRGLYLSRRTYVHTLEHLPPKRVLLAFVRSLQAVTENDRLVVETPEHEYTEKYRELTGEFYLNG